MFSLCCIIFFSPPPAPPPCSSCSVPEAPPRDVSGRPVDQQRIEVSWKPPVAHKQNGALAGYKIMYMPNEPGRADSEASVLNVTASRRSHTLAGLRTWTEYKIWVLAFTRVGDGPASAPILVHTDEDGR